MLRNSNDHHRADGLETIPRAARRRQRSESAACTDAVADGARSVRAQDGSWTRRGSADRDRADPRNFRFRGRSAVEGADLFDDTVGVSGMNQVAKQNKPRLIQGVTLKCV